MKNPLCLLLITIGTLLVSCSGNDSPTAEQFQNGVFVINEGNFQDGDGSLSFIRENGTIDNSIYSKANSGKLLGDVVQSMAISDERAYISVNNSNVLEVVNSNTMEWILTKDDVVFPRNVKIAEGRGYLTEWGVESGRLTEFDLETGATLRQVDTGTGAEDLLITEDRIYVSNVNWPGSGTVSAIDRDTFTKVGDVAVGIGPGGLVRDQAGNIWVICAGDYQVEKDGQLIRINEERMEADLVLDLSVDPLAKAVTDENGLILYYAAGATIYTIDLAFPSNGSSAFATVENAVSLYGIGFDAKGLLYVADSNGFQGNGIVFVFNEEGELTNEFQAGRGPNGFVFVQ